MRKHKYSCKCKRLKHNAVVAVLRIIFKDVVGEFYFGKDKIGAPCLVCPYCKEVAKA